MVYNEAIDRLSVYFTSPRYENEVLKAKAQFFGDVGIDDKECDRYEQWMNLFFDWYLFSRPLMGIALSPARFALEIDEFRPIIGPHREVFEKLSTCYHGIFIFNKVKGYSGYFKDLFSGKKVIVNNAAFALTLTKGALCDFRIIEEKKDFSMTKGFCAHPFEATRFIVKEAKEFKKKTLDERESFLLDLVRMFFKLEQYNHLESQQVYTRESHVRF